MEDTENYAWTARELMVSATNPDSMFAGTPEKVAEEFVGLAKQLGTDEVMVSPSPRYRRRSGSTFPSCTDSLLPPSNMDSLRKCEIQKAEQPDSINHSTRGTHGLKKS